MNNVDKQYTKLVEDILNNGVEKDDRTGTGTINVFRRDMRFKMSEGFPLLTTKKVFTDSIFHELLWFLGNVPEKYKNFGTTNIKYLVDNNVNIWNPDTHRVYKEKTNHDITLNNFKNKIKNDDDFAFKYGNLGPIYGEQWRNWGGSIDQLDNIINNLKENPDSRRLVVSAWNVAELPHMGLPPCHIMYQFYSEELTYKERYDYWIKNNYETGVEYFCDEIKNPINFNDNYYKPTPTRKLSLSMYQRSVDVFLGLPFNIASYATLLHMVSQVTNMIPNEFIWSGGDCHIYKNHIEQCIEQCSRKPFTKLPFLNINKNINNINNFTFNDLKIINYKSHDIIKGKMST